MDDGGNLRLRIRDWQERVRASFFVIPAVWVVGATVTAEALVVLERRIGPTWPPSVFTADADSARQLLGAVAAATMTGATVLFSLTLLAVQLGASQYSPRAVQSFTESRLQQNLVGVVVATFASSVWVLSRVTERTVDGDTVTEPRLATAVVMVAGLAALFALLASVGHTARHLRVTHVVADLAAATIRIIRETPPGLDMPLAAASVGGSVPIGRFALGIDGQPPGEPGGWTVRAPASAWVEQVSLDGLANALPEGSTIHLGLTVGAYVYEGDPIVAVTPTPDGDGRELRRDVLRSFAFGSERTLQEDAGYGVLQLVDVALRALSPAINDPNTADVAVTLLGDVLFELLRRPDAALTIEVGGRRIVHVVDPVTIDPVERAFGQIRAVSRDHPPVLVHLLQTLDRLRVRLAAVDRLTPTVRRRISAEAERICAEADRSTALESSRELVAEFADRFDLLDRDHDRAGMT